MSEMGRWVDPRVAKVRLADLRAYLLARGWKLKPFPRPEVILFEEPVARGKEPVVQLLPASEQVRDFRRGVIDAITSLSALENRHPVEVLDEILRHAADAQAPAPNGPGQSGETVDSSGSGPVESSP
jgi:hypothetical protein